MEHKPRRQIERQAPSRVRIDFACNDEGGIFQHAVSAIQLPGEMAELEPQRGDARFHVRDGQLILHRRQWPFVASKEYYGNIIWNAYWLQIDVAIELMVCLHQQQRWHCDSGWSDFWEAFNGEAPLNRVHLGAWLAAAAAAEKP